MPELLRNLPLKTDLAEFLALLRTDKASLVRRATDVFERSLGLAEPKVVFTTCSAEALAESTFAVGGLVIESRVIAEFALLPLAAFPFVATIGPDVEIRGSQCTSLTDHYCYDVAGNYLIGKLQDSLQRYLGERFGFQHSFTLQPGSSEELPLESQAAVFSLLGEVELQAGVRLTEAFTMVPRKSVSGICVPSQRRVEPCETCPSQRCTYRLSDCKHVACRRE